LIGKTRLKLLRYVYTGKVVPLLNYEAVKVYGESASIVPHILKLSIRCRWVISFTLWPL